MGKKLGFSSLFSKNLRDNNNNTWGWPLCGHPRTQSFRAGVDGEDVFKTLNSVYLDSAESWFTNTSEESAESFSTASEDSGGAEEAVETVIRGVRSDRLFFEPYGCASSSILAGAKSGVPFEESVVLAMESDDPYRDFRASMEEMVAANGMKDWECLEELLVWYLRVNGKKTHGYILGAFVDLLVGLASSPPPPRSSLSTFEIEEVQEEEKEVGHFI